MGVTKLWEVLKDVKTDVTLDEIKGQTLAVDLAAWICESEGVKQIHTYVARPYLRNLFFRVSNVLRSNINLVFVLDGKAPELKWDTISKRLASSGNSSKRGTSGVRSRLNSKLKECCILLDSLGVPWIKAEGEAEALCAALNKIGLVDGVITCDGDCFLYGALTVFRNFSVEKHVPFERYCIKDIERTLSLNQRDLIALGLLLGCDYCPKGVPGVGTSQAVKLISSFHGEDTLNVFKIWRKTGCSISVCEIIKKEVHCSTCGHEGSKKDHRLKSCNTCGVMCSTVTSKSSRDHIQNLNCICKWHKSEKDRKKHAFEEKIRLVAMQDSSFPDSDIINEFLRIQKYVNTCQADSIDPSRDPSLKNKFILKPPRLDVACKYLGEKLDWEVDYSLSKVLPLSTHFILNTNQQRGKIVAEVEISNIIKTRVKDRVPSLEIEWHLTERVDLQFESADQLITVESEESVKKTFPEIVDNFYKRIGEEKEEKRRVKAEVRKLERKKQKGSPKKSRAFAPQSSKMTDFYAAKKTRDNSKSKNSITGLKHEKLPEGAEKEKSDVAELEFSLSSLSLSNNIVNDKENCQGVENKICNANTSEDGIPKSNHKQKPVGTVKHPRIPVIVFSSDSESDDCDIDNIAQQFREVKLEGHSETRHSNVRSEKNSNVIMDLANMRSNSKKVDCHYSPLSDKTNSGKTVMHTSFQDNDVTFSNELDFSLGCSLLHTPLISMPVDVGGLMKSRRRLQVKSMNVTNSAEENSTVEQENVNKVTPAKNQQLKPKASEDSPVFMTLMQRLKSKNK